MAENQTYIDNLIAKYLAGEASVEEEQQLRHWMDDCDENKKYFGDIRFVHDQTLSSHKYIRVNTEKAWDKVKLQMKSQIQEPPTRLTKNKPVYQLLWGRVAASIILIAGSAILLYTLTRKPSQQISYSLASADSTISRVVGGNTHIVLNKNSKITFTHNRKEKKKELTLLGEAYFEVKHTPDTQLIVKAEETFIKDIGTAFNVKAYPGSSTIEVYVENGEVEFYTSNNSGIKLTQGKTGIYNKVNKTFHEIKPENINVLSYKTKLFIFKNTRLADAIEQLNMVYPVNITLSNPILENCTLTVTFDNEPIGTIVEIIAETLGLQVSVTDSGYVINGKQCISG